jgi:hypothetical protein
MGCFDSIYTLFAWLFVIYLFMGLGFELRALWLQSRSSTAWATPLVHFALASLEMGFLQEYAWGSLKLWSSQYQPLK